MAPGVGEDGDEVWAVGLFDAHCHPTDIMASIKDIAHMKARVLTVMSTRAQDQTLVENTAFKYPADANTDFSSASGPLVVPAFGWHPWMSHHLIDDRNDNEPTDPVQHYRSVLAPVPEDMDFILALPPPTPLGQYLNETRARLNKFPLALVGEVGLDRAFRLPEAAETNPSCQDAKQKTNGSEDHHTAGAREGRPLSPYRVSMEHQKTILRAQLELAAEMKRPVSLHSVQAHGIVFELLQTMWKGHEKPSKSARRKQRQQDGFHEPENARSSNIEEQQQQTMPLPYPPRVCMHSYSGPPDAVKQLLNPKIPTEVYFSFSIAINFSNPSSEKVINVIRLVPDDRILIESDLHCAGELMDKLLHEIVFKICEIRSWTVKHGAEQLKRNWIKFVLG